MAAQISSKLMKWGNSFGMVVPLSAVRDNGFSEGEELTAIIIKRRNPLKEMFGVFKFKKSVKKMMEEIDKELYNE